MKEEITAHITVKRDETVIVYCRYGTHEFHFGFPLTDRNIARACKAAEAILVSAVFEGTADPPNYSQ